MDDSASAAALIALAVLLLASALIDGIPKRKVDWSEATASQKDTALIVDGRKREQPRHLLKLSLLLLVVFGLVAVLMR